MLTRRGSRKEFSSLADEIVASARLDGDATDEARTCNYQLGNLVTPPDEQTAEELAARADRIFADAGDDAELASVLNNLGVSRHNRYDWARAVDSYLLSAAAFERVGDDVRLATVQNNIGEILSDRGELADAGRRFDEAERVWQAAGYRLGQGVVAMNKGRIELRYGRPAHAEELLDRSRAIFEAMDSSAFIAESLVRSAEAAIVGGDVTKAERLLAEVEAIDNRDVSGMAPWLSLTRAGCLYLRGDIGGCTGIVSEIDTTQVGKYAQLHVLEALAHLGEPERDGGLARSRLRADLGIVSLPLLLGLLDQSHPPLQGSRLMNTIE